MTLIEGDTGYISTECGLNTDNNKNLNVVKNWKEVTCKRCLIR